MRESHEQQAGARAAGEEQADEAELNLQRILQVRLAAHRRRARKHGPVFWREEAAARARKLRRRQGVLVRGEGLLEEDGGRGLPRRTNACTPAPPAPLLAHPSTPHRTFCQP